LRWAAPSIINRLDHNHFTHHTNHTHHAYHAHRAYLLYLPLQDTLRGSTFGEAISSRISAPISTCVMSNASTAKFGKDNLDAYVRHRVTEGAASPPHHRPSPSHTCPSLLVSARAFPHSFFLCLPVPGEWRNGQPAAWSLLAEVGLDLLGPPPPSRRRPGCTPAPLMLKEHAEPSQQPSQQEAAADDLQASTRSNHIELNLGLMMPSAPSALAGAAREALCRSKVPLPGEGEATVEVDAMPSLQPSEPAEQQPSEQQPSEPAEQQPSEQQPSLQQPFLQQPFLQQTYVEVWYAAYFPLPHPVPHPVPHPHPPSPHITTLACHIHRTPHPPYSHSPYLPYSPCFPFSSLSNSRHSHHSPQLFDKMAQLMRWGCEELTEDAAALSSQQLVIMMAELTGHHHSMLV
jgi:hypothetical protein